MVLPIILLIVSLAVLWLLFLPIDIYINTGSNEYFGKIKGLAKASIEADEAEWIQVRLNVPFREFSFFPLKPKKSCRKDSLQKITKKKKNTRYRFRPETIARMVKSFEIEEWDLDLDTGDCVTNAKLYPLFSLLDYRYGGFHINFEGRNRVLLWVRNRPIYLIKSFFNL